MIAFKMCTRTRSISKSHCRIPCDSRHSDSARKSTHSNSNMAAAGELQDEQKQKFYVFYCMECHAIFGDSLATARMNKNLKSISLNAVTEFVKVTKVFETSADGEDIGSTYHILECKSCHHPIGRMYDATPRKLDSIRDIYTLDWNKVKSYQLGRCTSKNIKPEIEDAELMTRSMLLDLIERVDKVTEKVDNVTDRVEKLESLVEEVGSDDEFPQNELDENRNEKKRKIR